jgi:hypothetical protein
MSDVTGTSGPGGKGFEAELDAMRGICSLLDPLDRETQQRILTWVANRCGMAGAQLDRSPNSAVLHRDDSPQVTERSFEHPAELFEAAQPKTDAEKALVLGYWFQALQGAAAFTSRPVNDELKRIGYGVGNITRALTQLIEARPALSPAGAGDPTRKIRKEPTGTEEIPAYARGHQTRSANALSGRRGRLKRCSERRVKPVS